jgi:hypothetical protein
MRFAHINEICEWCAEHGLEIDDPFQVTLPSFPHSQRLVFEVDGKPARASDAAAACIAAISDWDELLIWITLWDVWPSSEDWPDFYAWRGALGQKQSLSEIPGHIFRPDDLNLLRELFEKTMRNGWDARIICGTGDRADQLGAFISHDGYVDLFALRPLDVSW